MVKQARVKTKTNKKALAKAKKTAESIDRRSTKRKLCNKYKKPYDIFIAYADQVGAININTRDYADKADIPYQRIAEWRQWYIEDYGLDVKTLGNEIASQGYAVLKRLAALSMNANPKISLLGSKAFMDCSERYVSIIERFGFKAPTQSHDQGVFNLVVNSDISEYPIIDYPKAEITEE